MKGHIVAAYRRLCLGTMRDLEWFGWWLSAESHAPERHTLRTDLAWLGRILLRTVLAMGAGIFWAQLLGRNPFFIYAVPFLWAASAWRMSDWSATPPPRGVGARNGVDAGRARAVARGAQDPNGVMCIYHPTTDAEVEEVNTT
ncbi:hypothetical protein ACIRJL_17165 [Streptomyces sp. NPDC102383]|uniref:hypothetical protein n=1 Tax=Streptomyces sp. NPDC102383 TaxID=3366165 RepID=UPI003801BD62